MGISKKRPLNAATAVALLIGLTVLLGVGSIPAAHAATSSVVQTKSAFLACGTSTCTLQATFPANVASGDVVVVGLSFGTVSPLKTFSDSLGSSFTQTNSTSPGGLAAAIEYSTLASSGPDTVTATFSLPCAPGCSGAFSMHAFEVSGVTTSGAASSAGRGNTFSPPTTVSVASTAFQPGAFLLSEVTVFPQPSPFSSPSPWTTESDILSAATYATSGVASPTTFPVGITNSDGMLYWTEVALALNPIPTVTTTTTSTYTTTQTVIVTATSTGTVTSTQTSTTVIATGSCGTTTTTTSGPNHEPRPRGEDPTQTVTSTATTTVTSTTTFTATETTSQTATSTTTVTQSTCTSTPVGVPQFPSTAGLGSMMLVALLLPVLLLLDRRRRSLGGHPV